MIQESVRREISSLGRTFLQFNNLRELKGRERLHFRGILGEIVSLQSGESCCFSVASEGCFTLRCSLVPYPKQTTLLPCFFSWDSWIQVRACGSVFIGTSQEVGSAQVRQEGAVEKGSVSLRPTAGTGTMFHGLLSRVWQRGAQVSPGYRLGLVGEGCGAGRALWWSTGSGPGGW